MHLVCAQSTVPSPPARAWVPDASALPSAAWASAALRTELGECVSSFVQPLSARVSEAAAAKVASTRNLVPVFVVFLVSEGMRGLYAACIYAVHSAPSNNSSR